ncbi:MAG: hypothetical protein EON53_08945 [Actinomycetales bacterium]|nr:MAG: hypothetical protein EON53_08945 [Actinomycetales bacterium]
MSTTTHPATAPARPGSRAVPEPIPFGRVVGVEMRKTFDTRAGTWLLASIGIVAVLATAAVMLWAPDDALTFETFGSAVGTPMAVLLPVVSILLVTGEWSQRSGLTTFTLVPRRGRTIAAKAVVTTIIGVCAMALALVVALGGAYLGPALRGTEPAIDLTVGQVGTLVLAQVLGMFVGFMLGVVTRSSAVALVAYFVFWGLLPTLSQLLYATQDWYRDVVGWVDFGWAHGALYEGGLSATEWAQLGAADRRDLGDVEPGEDAVEHLGVVPALGTQVEQRLALVVQHRTPQPGEVVEATVALGSVVAGPLPLRSGGAAAAHLLHCLGIDRPAVQTGLPHLRAAGVGHLPQRVEEGPELLAALLRAVGLGAETSDHPRQRATLHEQREPGDAERSEHEQAALHRVGRERLGGGERDAPAHAGPHEDHTVATAQPLLLVEGEVGLATGDRLERPLATPLGVPLGVVGGQVLTEGGQAWGVTCRRLPVTTQPEEQEPDVERAPHPQHGQRDGRHRR